MEKNNQRLERYGSVSSWAKECNVSADTLYKKLQSQQGISGENSSGRVLLHGFYSERQVKNALGKLYSISIADENGFIFLNSEEGSSERYATAQVWAKEIGVSRNEIRRRLKGITGIEGRHGSSFSELGFYPESIIVEKCEDLIGISQAGEDGFFTLTDIKNEHVRRYGTLQAWSEERSLSRSIVKQRLRNVTSIIGRDVLGRKFKFYLEEDVLRKLADEPMDLPKENAERFIYITGEGREKRFATTNRWVEILRVSYSTLLSRLNQQSSGMLGVTWNGSRSQFYEEELVRELCADLIIPEALHSRDGLYILTEKGRMATCKQWSREFSLNHKSMQKRLHDKQKERYKDSSGRVRNFYLESVVHAACQDLLSSNSEDGE